LDYADRAVNSTEACLPVLVALGSYDGRSDVLAFVRRQLAEAVIEDEEGRRSPLPAHQRLADRLMDELNQQRLAIFFDGLNEMPRDNYTAAINRLEAFRNTYPGNRFLFTCREADYTTVRLPLPDIHVESLSDDAIRDFIRAYLSKAPEQAERLSYHLEHENRPVWEISQNPYLLRMVLSIFKSQGALPANRSELFTHFVGTLLLREFFTHPDRWHVSRRKPARNTHAALLAGLADGWYLLKDWESRPEDYELDSINVYDRHALLVEAGLAVTALSKLAYAMSAAGQRGTTVPEDFVLQHLAKPIRLHNRQVSIDSKHLIYLARSASLIERNHEGSRFTHQLLQEYFAAVHLNALGLDHPLALECLHYDAWDETIVLLAGLTPLLDRLLENLLSLNPFLASRCTGVKPAAISPNVTENLVTTLTHLGNDFFSPWQIEAIIALGRTRLLSAMPAITGFLQNHFDDVRRAAVEALGVLKAQEAIPHLIERLGDANGDVRLATVKALEQLRAREAISHLIELLGDEGVSRVSANALENL